MDKIREIELNDSGSIICKYNVNTLEILEIYDWRGNDLTGTKWDKIAQETILDLHDFLF